MKKNFRNGLLMLAAGALVVSCADYNDLGGFKADFPGIIGIFFHDPIPVDQFAAVVGLPPEKIGDTQLEQGFHLGPGDFVVPALENVILFQGGKGRVQKGAALKLRLRGKQRG